MRRIILVMAFLLLAGLANLASADELLIAQTVQAGQETEYHFELRNDSEVAHDYGLAVTGFESGLESRFTQGSSILDSVSVDAASSETIILIVSVPLDWAVGHYSAELVLSRDDGETLRLPIALTVENTYALEIISQNLDVSSFSGQEFRLEVTAANTGAADIHNIRVAVDTPAKWIVDSSPTSIDTLAANESASFTLVISVPASELAMEHEISIHLESEEIASPDSSVLVRVQNNPNYLLYAGAITLVVIVGVFIYFRLRGRR